YGYVEGFLKGEDGIPILRADTDGWTWTALIQEGLYQWTRMTFNSKSLEETFRPDIFKDLRPRGKSRSADVTWRMIKQLCGNGCFIIGDAAAVLDPASSHGVLRAIMSGIKATDLIANVLSNVCEEEVAEIEYSRWFREWFSHDLKNLHQLYLKVGQNLWRSPDIVVASE
ncbi:MAG TPA: hypothetical protein VHD33_02480, partial [Legionellaceae bacterium]|nr:hypothetical protein [Legionellaceae bacterium]